MVSPRNLNRKAIFAELQKRAAKPKIAEFTVNDYCFDKQLEFIKSTAKFKTAVCSRRAGKSEACAADLVDTAYNNPRVNCLYITLSRTSAERIIWRLIINILKDYKIEYKANNKELIVALENGSNIYVSGAKDSVEIEKFRGMSLKKVYIDESQSFKAYIKELVEDVLMPATWDVNGQIALIGTPGPIPQGYFFDMSHNKSNANFKWNILDNPWIKKKSGKYPAEILAEERERKGITEADPTYMREALGLWVQDSNALVFRFDKRKNIYDKVPEQLNYIFGIDIGYNDADAIAVIGYSLKDPNVYLVEEVITKKQNITSLVEQIKELQIRYKPIKMVMDAGALGKKIQDEIRTRHGLPLEAAHKERKLEYIELLNDDLRTGKFKTFKGSVFEEDCNMVVWEYSGAHRVVSDRTHSDIHDSAIYAFREAKHYIPKDEPYLIPNKNSNEFMALLEERDAEKSRQEESGETEDWPIDQEEMDSIFDVYDNSGIDDY